VRSGVVDLLGRGASAPDFACVKVRASADVVLASLGAYAYGTPRDLSPVVRGAPCPADGRELGRRAVLYKLERDGWTTVVREGDRFASFDSLLAARLSRTLQTRAVALYIDGNGQDLAYDVVEKGESVASFLHVEGTPPESQGVPGELLRLDVAAHARVLLAREDATNDRLAFRHFELPGMLRGRWDLGFERAILIPELVTIEESSEERRVRIKKVKRAPEPEARPKGEIPRGVQDLLGSIIADSTRGL
jgi:hypothetical protein